GTGRVRLLNGHKVASENTLELDVHTLRPGLFLLYVQTDKGRRVLKFVKE
ncbi:MAG: T9SS type A sorting domain-containing protein, partial [Cytophagales bacterium]|nr:T9SS type A sorting domain-containing protein [Cytophagales bacterium]